MNREVRKMKRSPEPADHVELAILLLRRSVKFRHPRLLQKRLLDVLELGVPLPKDVMNYLREGR